ncbi:MAG: UbiA family prenyltransferase [Patescibacteria group bacterium]|nr:UbiA family prenyltransferase [Patescibacteria group bacterium]
MNKSESLSINRLFQAVWNEFVYGGHLVSISNFSIVICTIVLLQISFDLDVFKIISLSYLITFFVYNYNHIFELDRDAISNPERTKHLSNALEIYRTLIIIAFLLFIYISGVTSLKALIYLLFIAIVGVFYPKHLTKKITAFKNIYTAFFWSTIVFLPLLFLDLELGPNVFLFFVFVLIRSILNAVYYDIKDIDSDKREGLKTLPVIIGKEATVNFLHILNILSFCPLIIGFYFGVIPLIFLVGLVPVLFYALFYLTRVNKASDSIFRNLSYVMVDGEYIFWALSLLSIKYLFGV